MQNARTFLIISSILSPCQPLPSSPRAVAHSEGTPKTNRPEQCFPGTQNPLSITLGCRITHNPWDGNG